tara:strand:- start:390 stop:743 length:354 start_codon:yes stop_codon:yes gene_type:complete
MPNINFKIKTEFSSTPGPRYRKEGKWSGEYLREDFIYPIFLKALSDNSKVFIDLDGTAGYGTSFLEEVFGGLLRVNELDYDEIISSLELKSDEEPYLIEDIHEYLLDAKKQNDAVIQ